MVDRSACPWYSWRQLKKRVEIEKVAEETPEKILKERLTQLVGLQPAQAREVAFKLGLKDKQINEFAKLMTGLIKPLRKMTFLFEINPLAVHVNLAN